MRNGKRSGVVYLIGAGPGEPGLLTVRAAECLAAADAVYYDQELPARLLEYAPRAAARFAVGSATIGDLLLQAADKGRVVVRLHAGAADLRGPAGEEARVLRRAGVPFELVSGVASTPPESLRCHLTRPLSGQTVLVTRPTGQADSLARPLEALGAKVYRWPFIEIGPPPDAPALDHAFERLRDFQWLVFTSAAGVEAWMRELMARGHDLRHLGHLKLAAIGPKTAAALARHHLRADVIPTTFDSDHLAQALLPATRGQTVLLARADRGRDLLLQVLSQVARVTEVAVYGQVDNLGIDQEILRELRLGRVDWVTLTSSNLARAFARVVDDQIRPWLSERTRLVCLSPLTASAAQAAGLPVAGAASTFTVEGLIRAMLELVEQTPEPASQPT